jgi:acyl-CoA reductase-like NAD-dependent aldehyde dehydrogenase
VVQGGAEVGAALVDAPCDKLSFIGSTAVGRRVAEAAAKHLTPVVMELGGKDAAIVLEDADLDNAASGVLWGSFLNAGQTCCAIERAYVLDSVYDGFVDKLTTKLSGLRHGREDGDIGSLTFKAQLEKVERHVEDAVDKGATVLSGGTDGGRNAGGSLWFEPTVLEGVTDAMDLFNEETFGPMLPLFRVRDEDEAVRRANEDSFNLTASVWSGDRRRAERVAARLRAGSVAINDHAAGAGAPWGAWGGVGESGYGRLNGPLGIRELTYPVHVGRSLTPHQKRLWWYPYDEASTTALRAVAETIAAPGLRKKAEAAGRLLVNARKALGNKI